MNFNFEVIKFILSIEYVGNQIHVEGFIFVDLIMKFIDIKNVFNVNFNKSIFYVQELSLHVLILVRIIIILFFF
jgi:hypothetical protein